MSSPYLPDIDLYVGLASDILIEPDEGVDFDWSVWQDVEFSCLSLAISKKLTTGAAALEVTAAGKNVLIHVVGADVPATKTLGPRDYQMKVKSGGEWRDVAGTGVLRLNAPA